MKITKKKVLFLIPLIVFCLAAFFSVFAVRAYLRMPLYVFVQDSSWKVLNIDKDFKSVKRTLLKNGIRFKILTLKVDDSVSYESVKKTLSVALKAKKVLLNPVALSCCNTLDINVKEILPDSIVMGIGRNNQDGRYDYVFTEDTGDAWSEADMYLSGKKNVIFCKTARDLYNILKTHNLSGNTALITDFKLRQAVPEGALAGFIIPDFAEAFMRFESVPSADLTELEPPQSVAGDDVSESGPQNGSPKADVSEFGQSESAERMIALSREKNVGKLRYNVFVYDSVIDAVNTAPLSVTDMSSSEMFQDLNVI